MTKINPNKLADVLKSAEEIVKNIQATGNVGPGAKPEGETPNLMSALGPVIDYLKKAGFEPLVFDKNGEEVNNDMFDEDNVDQENFESLSSGDVFSGSIQGIIDLLNSKIQQESDALELRVLQGMEENKKWALNFAISRCNDNPSLTTLLEEAKIIYDFIESYDTNSNDTKE